MSCSLSSIPFPPFYYSRLSTLFHFTKEKFIQNFPEFSKFFPMIFYTHSTFTARLLTSVIKIKLNHLTKHFVIFARAKDITQQHQPTHSAKSHTASPNPIFSRKKKEFYDSWFALFLDVIFAVKPQPYILFYVLCRKCMCVRMCLDTVMIYFQTIQICSSWTQKVLNIRGKIFFAALRSVHVKKWSLFKRWKSWPRIIVEGKAPKFKNCSNPRLSSSCHAQSINFSSDFYLANYECGFLFDFSSFDFPCKLCW